jgi:hypothetical protein
MMNDYFTAEEKQQLEDELNSLEWTYTVTFTLPVDSPSIGDIWMLSIKACERLTKKDVAAVYCLFVCINSDERSWERPHVHGLVRTSLTPAQVKSCFHAKETWVHPFTRKHPGDWIGYVVKQAIRETQLHNMENSYATIQTR